MTTETLTDKLHKRSDKKLKDELDKLVEPLCVRLQYNGEIPFQDREEMRSVIWRARDALFSAEQPKRRELEVAEFIKSVESTRDALDSLDTEH